MADLELRRFADPAAFAAVAQPFLLRDEATHCLQLGLIEGIAAGEWSDPYLAVVDGPDSAPALVALRTPPHNLLLSRCDELSALGPLLADRLEANDSLTGVLGPTEVADAFAEGWGRASGVPFELRQRQGIYRLERVEPVALSPGGVRRAAEADRDLLTAWMSAFLAEALPGNQFDAVGMIGRWLGSPQRALFFWEAEGEPVAMAGVGSPTPSGIRVSAVYTPHEQRGNGYATSLVATLSRRELDGGRRFCFLFTDLANPVSNRVYRRIGYRQVSQASEYRFGEAAESRAG
jgi:predicted GNAT family acetyltransferase